MLGFAVLLWSRYEPPSPKFRHQCPHFASCKRPLPYASCDINLVSKLFSYFSWCTVSTFIHANWPVRQGGVTVALQRAGQSWVQFLRNTRSRNCFTSINTQKTEKMSTNFRQTQILVKYVCMKPCRPRAWQRCMCDLVLLNRGWMRYSECVVVCLAVPLLALQEELQQVYNQGSLGGVKQSLKTQWRMGRWINRDTRISFGPIPIRISLDQDSSSVPILTLFFVLAFVTHIGFVSHPLKNPNVTTTYVYHQT
jgi:hypothetical protein